MAPSTTNYAEIQHDEIEALRSIYMDDFIEAAVKTGAWNKAVDRSFMIKLRKSNDESGETIDFGVSLPSTYPKSLPRLTVKFGGETHQRVKVQCEDILRTKPKSLVGSEMIFEIATALQDILDSTEVNPKTAVTLDEERAAKLEAARKKNEEDDERHRLEELKMQQEEEQLLQELVVQHQSRSAKRVAKPPQSPIDGTMIADYPPGTLKFEQPSCMTRSPEGLTISIDAVYDRTKYRQGSICQIFTVQPFGPAIGTGASQSTPYLALKDYHIPSKGADEVTTKRAVQNLESKLEYHMSLSPHRSIIKPLNFHIRRRLSNDESKPHGWDCSILTELAERNSLRETLEIVEKLSVKSVRAWSIQLIEGLDHYHRHGAAHADLHLGNILLRRDREAEKGERKIIVAMLSDGGYQHELHRLKKYHGAIRQPPAWSAPETGNANGSEEVMPTTDIWNFGCCFLQMAFGLGILNDHPLGPMQLIQGLRMTSSLKVLLTQMFHANPKRRSSAWDLLHFEFFRNDDEVLEIDPIEEMTTLRPTMPGLSTSHIKPRRESVPLSATSSRYAKDFVEDGRLGRGGFGEVFRARNKVDGQPYAIKKVKARTRGALDPVLSEVTVLSRLNHPNVVRYFASWIEDSASTETSDISRSSGGEYSWSLENTRGKPTFTNSSRGLDFISSNNAHVVFGIEDEEGIGSAEDEDDSFTESEKDNASDSDNSSESGGSSNEVLNPLQTKASHDERQVWTVLYIQMEYCKQETLRDLINSGLQANANEVWRLFRQIVQGLAHIHGLSIVHRDLKPENIFIDSDGDVRIGDFGLARPGDYRTVSSQANADALSAREGFGSFTKDVGTASYVAPEVRSAGNGKYNEKADMFSLGVVFLEMNVAFSTGMERAEALEQLQKDNCALPPSLLIPEKATQARVLVSLVQNKPSKRPSSSELISHGDIPDQAEDESLRMARRLLNDRSSHYRTQFISSLFTKEERRIQDSTTITASIRDPLQAMTLLDDVAAMSGSSPNHLELQALVREKLAAIFQRHGAVERTDSPAVIPYHSCYSTDEVFRFVSTTGKVMQLPYDLILPNAVLLARQVRADRKTYIFDDVYRTEESTDHPQVFKEANFDIVSEEGEDLILREAEVMKVIDEILDLFPNLSSLQICYHINHSQLLNSILRFCDIHSSKWSSVKEAMSKLHIGDYSWASLRHELRGSSIALAATSLDELERFDFRDTCNKVIPRLRSIFKDSQSLEPIYTHLNAITEYLVRLNVRRKIYVNPLSSYNERFYSGSLLFQCLYDQKRRSVFAAGGRYDQLIRDHQPIMSRKAHVHAVGCQLAWSGLCLDVSNYLKKISKSKGKRKGQSPLTAPWRTRRSEVLVRSFDRDLLNSIGVQILQELWANNISSELAEHGAGVTGENSFARTPDRSDEHNWTILIKAEGHLKVRNTSRNDEVELQISELIPHIRNEIRERDRIEERASKAPLLRLNSQQESVLPSNDQEPDIKVLTSQNKGKKVNRKTIIEEAKTHRRLYLQSCTASPIIAIETKDDTFDGIADTRLSDPESWKRFIQSAAPGERQYLGQLQNMLKGIAKEAVEEGTTGTAIIYNFRTKACVGYYLGRAG